MSPSVAGRMVMDVMIVLRLKLQWVFVVCVVIGMESCFALFIILLN